METKSTDLGNDERKISPMELFRNIAEELTIELERLATLVDMGKKLGERYTPMRVEAENIEDLFTDWSIFFPIMSGYIEKIKGLVSDADTVIDKQAEELLVLALASKKLEKAGSKVYELNRAMALEKAKFESNAERERSHSGEELYRVFSYLHEHSREADDLLKEAEKTISAFKPE